MKNLKYYLGLDLGISSVGWAVMAEDPQTNKHTLYDFGVRLFDIPEVSKTKVSLATQRRGVRSTRRLIRRRKHRLDVLKTYLAKISFLTFADFETQFNLKATNKLVKSNGTWTTEAGFYNPYVIKAKGLNQQLSKPELYAILINYANRRGYLDKFSFDETDQSDDKTKTVKKVSKLDSAINTAEELVKKYKTISQAVLNSNKFTIFNSATRKILWTQNNNKLVSYNNKLVDFKTLIKRDPDAEKEVTQESYRWLFARADYQAELKQILNTQAQFYSELTPDHREQISAIIFQTRDFEMGAKCRECTEFMLENPSDYKTKIKNCQSKSCSNFGVFWDMTGKCHFYPTEERASKASLIFTVFYFINELSKVWLFLEGDKTATSSNLEFTIAEKRVILRKLLFSEWKTHSEGVKLLKAEIIQTETWKKFGRPELLKSPLWTEDKKDENTGLSLKKPILWQLFWQVPALRKTLETLDLKSDQIITWKHHLFDQIGITCARWITPARRETKLNTLLKENKVVLKQSELDRFKKDLKKKDTEPGKTSFKYMIEAIMVYLEKGTPYAVFQASFNKKRSEKKDEQFKESNTANLTNLRPFHRFSDSDMMTNPVVLRAISQTRKVLKALHKQFNHFQTIVVEVGRDLYSNKKDRDRMSKAMLLNYDRKEKIIAILKKHNLPINKSKILAYDLWEQQAKKCLYCFKTIEIEALDTEYEIDHIIPRSLCPDDSPNNKVLVCRSCNQSKGQRIPYQYLKNSWSKFSSNVISLKKKISALKRMYLLCKRAENAVEEFSSRNLNDTRYISKYIHNYIQEEVKKHGIKAAKVFAVPGQIVSRLRRTWLSKSAWGLDKKVRDITPYHHAIDAIILSQLKKQTDIFLATDLIKLNEIKRRIKDKKSKERDKLTQLYSAKNDLQTMIINKIKVLREKYNVDFYEQQIMQALKKDEQTHKNFYIQDLVDQIETRIPIQLEIEKCRICFDQDDNKLIIFNCKECGSRRELPKYVNILNPKEWAEKTQNFDKTNINLRYPHISRMVIYKVKGSITSSENLGFGDHQKNLLFKLWSKNKNLTLEQAREKRQLNNLKQVHFKRWIKAFIEKKEYLVNRFGSVVPLNSFYGVYFPKNNDIKPQFIRIIDAKTDKQLAEKYSNLLINNRLIEYFDKRFNKQMIKFYSGKTNERLVLTPNLFTKSPTEKKYQQLFGKTASKTDSLVNIINSDWKILNVDVLGNITKN